MQHAKPGTAILLSVLLLVLSQSHALSSAPERSKISSSLALLVGLHQEHPDRLPPDALPLAGSGKVRALLRCSREPGKELKADLGQLGVEFDGSHLRVPKGWLKSCRVPVAALEVLSRKPYIDLIDSAWQPGVVPTLDVSAQAVGAPAVWQMIQPAQAAVSTSKIVVADFDAGVDVFHPALWNSDGPAYSWLDTDGSQTFTSGVDAVDLNFNGLADPGEKLSYLKAPVKDSKNVVTNSSGPFVAGLDWLYNDANGNGVRDYGLSFGESTPTYGERIFVLHDTDFDGKLSPGETINALGSSKIAAVMGAYGAMYNRGENLISVPADTSGHGTAVCGILAGLSPGFGKYVGISPGIDVLVADQSRNDFTQYIAWAEAKGARVMLYEFGAWTYQFMDGTSPLEQAISSEWDKGIVQVIPAGNLANGKKHATMQTSGGSGSVGFTVPSGRGINTVYLTVLWSAQTDALTFKIRNPAGVQTALMGDLSFYADPSGNLYWSNGVQVSEKGTRRFDIYISGVSSGAWQLTVNNPIKGIVRMHAYVSDNIAGWSGGTYFTSGVSKSSTVSWPATADKALVVGSYSTRGIGVPAGSISDFSGRGPRIDGADIVDICAPGNYDVFSPCSKDVPNPFGSYRAFSGTSAAAPHVASACALLLHLNPTLSSDDISYLIQAAGASDAYTGTTPNDVWGYGKLSVAPAAQGVGTVSSETARSVKSKQDGDPVTLFGKLVVAVIDAQGCFYLEESNRSSGVRVLGTGVAEGDKVSISGAMTTVGVERSVDAHSVSVLQHMQILPQPLTMKNPDMGDWHVRDAGLDNVGLLITVWGRVTGSASDRFTIDDGSGASVQVSAAGISIPTPGAFVIATGISSLAVDSTGVQRMLLPRSPGDVRVIL